MRPVPLRAVAALFLERQHLARPRAAALTARRLGRFVEDVGGLQLDSINVLERAHYLTVWSRFGAYDRARLDRLAYRSEEHTSELQSHSDLVCRLLLEKKKHFRSLLVDISTHL